MPVSNKSQRNPKPRDRVAGALTLGSYVYKLRQERGMSLRDLRDKTSISLSTLCRLEKGDHVPSVQNSIDALDKLWMALGGDMNQFLYLSRRCPLCNGLMVLGKDTRRR